jgi:hypothetical protein
VFLTDFFVLTDHTFISADNYDTHMRTSSFK